MRSTVALMAMLVMAGCAGDPSSPTAQLEASLAASHTSSRDARSVWIRLSPAGVAALPRFAIAQAGPAPTIELSETSSGDFTVCTEGQCTLSLQFGDVVATADRAGLDLSVSAEARSSAIGLRYEQSWACAFAGRPECSASVDTTREAPPVLRATARAEVEVDGPTGRLALRPTDVSVPIGLDGGDISVAGRNTCGRVWCSVANITGATAILSRLANQELEARLAREVGGRLCRSCGAGCPVGTRCEAGICIRDTGSCVPASFAVEATLASEDERGEALFAFALADEARVRAGGLDLAARLTTRISAPHRCVPSLSAPTQRPLPSAVLSSASDDAMIRVAISETAISRVFWALSASGVACREVAIRDIPLVGAGGLSALFPSASRLDGLASDGRVTLAPLETPSVEIRADGGVTVGLPLSVAVEAQVLGRRVRLASARIDMSLVARMTVHEGIPTLAIAQSDVGTSVGDVWATPLLGADPDGLAGRFDAIAGLARAVVPARVPLSTVALPVPVELVGTPHGVGIAGTHALIVDLNLRAAP